MCRWICFPATHTIEGNQSVPYRYTLLYSLWFPDQWHPVVLLAIPAKATTLAGDTPCVLRYGSIRYGTTIRSLRKQRMLFLRDASTTYVTFTLSFDPSDQFQAVHYIGHRAIIILKKKTSSQWLKQIVKVIRREMSGHFSRAEERADFCFSVRRLTQLCQTSPLAYRSKIHFSHFNSMRATDITWLIYMNNCMLPDIYHQ